MKLGHDKWQSAQALFEAALAQPPAQWSAFLAQATADKTLRTFVQKLLDAHAQSGTVAPESTPEALTRIFEESHRQDWEGRLLGRYRLVKKIGEGGMGLVYQAKRDDDTYEKKAAVKLIRFDITNELNRAHFATERQLMARLEHPNIAQLIDGGTHEGVPYLVMEYVDGLPVTNYCDDAGLDLGQRLALFLKVCDAVQIAHQNLIVHRDIKPSNILVTTDGSPKLLDFGIAKLLDPSLDQSGANPTVTQQRKFTPSYASPEQLLGKSVTTATDLYSLGVLLFELLSGFRPFSEEERTPVELAAAHQDPASPSSVLTQNLHSQDGKVVSAIAACRSSKPRQLSKLLRGDLDAIVLKALRPNPSHRYHTVTQLAEDVRRYLAREPVWARKRTMVYQAVKFCWRHATAVSAAVLLTLASLVFLTYTHFQSLRLAKERDLAQASTRLFVDSFQMADPGRARGETVTAMEILEHAEAKVAREHREHPELQANLQAAMGQVYLNLHMNDRADPLLHKAVAVQTRIFGPDDLRTASTKESLAQLAFNRGQYDDAERLALETLNLRTDFQGPPLAIVRSLNLAANARRAGGDRQGALPLFKQALSLLRQEGEASSLELVQTLNALGYTFTLLFEFEKAEPLYLEGLAILERTIPEPYPLKARILRRLCNLYIRWDNLEKAAFYLQAALNMNRLLYGEEHTRIAVNLHDLAKLKNKQGDPFLAELLYRESLAMKTKLLGESHPGLNGTLINLASILHQQGAWIEAETLYWRALNIHHARFKQANLNLAFLERKYGMLLKDIGHWMEAERLFCSSMDGFLNFSSRPVRRHAETQLLLAATWLLQGRSSGVESALNQCLPVFQKRNDNRRIAQVRALFTELQGLPKVASQ